MGIYQEESVAILHEAADVVISRYNLKGDVLDSFVNGVYMLEYAFSRGLGERRAIEEQFRHILTFDSVSLARTALIDLQALLLK